LKHIFIFIFTLLSVICFTNQSYGQKKIVQFSGIVVGGDSLYGISDVAVFVPRTGRGIFSNHIGYFSLPVLSGDTVRIKSVGFKDKNFAMPDTADYLSVVIQLELDTFLLPEIVLWPYPDFNDFKKAFLALELSNPSLDYTNKNLNEKVLRRMLYNTEQSSSANYRYYLNNQANKQQYRYSTPYMTLLNPFAWARFIKDVKSGGLKNEKWEEIDKRKHEKDYND
jgi:hypothetical protein